MVQLLLAIYMNAIMHSVTDGQTDRRHYDINNLCSNTISYKNHHHSELYSLCSKNCCRRHHHFIPEQHKQ